MAPESHRSNWVRYRANEAQPWGAWSMALSGNASPLTYTFANGDGRYEFYTIAVDVAGNREAPPAVADAVTHRDAVDDSPDFSVTLSTDRIVRSPDIPDLIALDGSGLAADDRSTVSVKWQLYGVRIDGTVKRLTSMVLAEPLDGSFDSASEGFGLSDGRADSGYVAYDVHIKVSAGTRKTTRIVRVAIDGAAQTQSPP